MLCSRCSDNVQPVIAVDIDGTLAQYHAPLARFAEQFFGRIILARWDGTGDFEEYMGLTRPEYRQLKLAYRQGGFKRFAPTYTGAVEMMRHLNTLDAEVWITTTRPWSRLDNIDPDTQFWLEDNGIPFDHLMYDEEKYKVLSTLVDPERVVMVVDDLPEMIAQANEHLPHSFNVMVARQHNVATRSPYNVIFDLQRLAKEAQILVEGWHARHRHD